MQHLYRLWRDDQGQDIAEYAVMLAVILVIVRRHRPADWLECKQCVFKRRQFHSVRFCSITLIRRNAAGVTTEFPARFVVSAGLNGVL